MAYTDQGEGEAVLLIHGFCETKDIWNGLMPGLTAKYRVIAVDSLGFGDSAPEAGFSFSMRSQAEAILLLLKELAISRCAWIGHSMGGYISLEAAGMQPDIVAGLLLLHSTASADTPERKDNRNKTIEVVKRTPELFIREFYYNLFAPGRKAEFADEIETFKKEAANIDPAYIIGTLEGLRDRPGYIDVLNNLSVPVFYIIGRHDQILPADALVEQATAAGAEYAVLENSGHMGMLEEPGATEAGVMRALGAG